MSLLLVALASDDFTSIGRPTVSTVCCWLGPRSSPRLDRGRGLYHPQPRPIHAVDILAPRVALGSEWRVSDHSGVGPGLCKATLNTVLSLCQHQELSPVYCRGSGIVQSRLSV